MNKSEALFYDYGHIEAQLKCPKCANKLVDPVFLPCGASACNKCLSNLLNSRDPSSPIECPSCALSHSFPQSPQFIPNLLLANILQQRPMDIERIRHVCEFKSRLADINAKLGCMERMLTDGGREEIREWYKNLRFDVLLAAEKRVQRIHEMGDCLLDQLAACERQSLEKISKSEDRFRGETGSINILSRACYNNYTKRNRNLLCSCYSSWEKGHFSIHGYGQRSKHKQAF